MSAFLYAAEVHDLEWYFDRSDGDVKQLRSTWHDEVLAKSLSRPRIYIRGASPYWTDAAPMRCGTIYVSKKRHAHRAHFEMNTKAVAAATRQRRIWSAFISCRWPVDPKFSPPAGVLPSEVLRLRFREVLPESRYAFGRAGFAADEKRPLDIARLVNVRGPGALAHLVASTQAAWSADRTTLPIEQWTDRLGRRLRGLEGRASLRLVATAAERDLSRAIIRECAALELWALEAYRRAVVRVPEMVRKGASQRAARHAG